MKEGGYRANTVLTPQGHLVLAPTDEARTLPGAGRILDSSKLADVFGTDFGAADPKSSPKPIGKKSKSAAPRKAKSAKRVGKRR